MEKRKCFFCGEVKKTFKAGICLGMTGLDYRFCLDCLHAMDALTFWRRIFEGRSLKWPPTWATPPGEARLAAREKRLAAKEARLIQGRSPEPR